MLDIRTCIENILQVNLTVGVIQNYHGWTFRNYRKLLFRADSLYTLLLHQYFFTFKTGRF